MEVVFFNSRNFFPQPGQPDHRPGGKPPQKPHAVGHQTGQKEGRAAEGQKVGHRPQKEGADHVNTHLSAGGEGVEEQGRRDHHPKEEVQSGPHQGEPHPPPEDAKQVVDQPYPHPQRQGAGKGEGLVQQVDIHLSEQPGEEAAPVPGIFLVGQGVHRPLHL